MNLPSYNKCINFNKLYNFMTHKPHTCDETQNSFVRLVTLTYNKLK